jgi:hypothetical protein
LRRPDPHSCPLQNAHPQYRLFRVARLKS